MRETWRRYWPHVLLAVGVIVIAVSVLSYVLHRTAAHHAKTPTVRHTATPRPTPEQEPPRTSLVIIEPPAPVAATVSPSPSRTASPRPTPTRGPSPHPTPTPSPTCSLHRLVTDPTSCLHL